MTPTQPDRNADAASLDLEAIKARAAAATEGPWEWGDPTIGQHWSRPQPWATVVDDEVNCGDYCYGGSSSPIKSDADGQFLAHAREDIPALVAEVERLRGQLDNPRDEYHTMDELYHYRMLYNAMCANILASHGGDVHKSWRHADGELCFGGGWFIVTMQLPTGQVSNHYKAAHWDAFRVHERENAAAWDGHTPEVAAERMERCAMGEW